MSDYAKDVLVEADWLESTLNDEGIRIVEVDENPKLYAEAHIPGAIGFDWQRDLQDQVRRDFLGPEDFGALFGSPRRLRRSHDRALRRSQQLVRRLHLLVPEVLRPRQRPAAERPPRKVDRRRAPDDRRASPATPPASFTAKPGDDAIRARREEVLPRSTPPRSSSTCAPRRSSPARSSRPPGYEQEGAQRGGHIPGAASIPWAQAVSEDGTFKSAQELRDLYGGKGVLDGERHHRLLPHRRALRAHLVRAARAPRPRARQELRRLLDRVGQPRRRPGRDRGVEAGQSGGALPRGPTGVGSGVDPTGRIGSRGVGTGWHRRPLCPDARLPAAIQQRVDLSSRSSRIRAVAPQMRCSSTM